MPLSSAIPKSARPFAKRAFSRYAPWIIYRVRDYRMRKIKSADTDRKRLGVLLSLAEDIDNRSYDETRPEVYPDISDGIGTHAIVEINNTCNIDCLSCKTSLATRKRGKISEGLLTESLDELKRIGVKSVALHTIGDPFMFPRLGLVFEELRKRGMTAAISTNGLLLHRQIDALLDYFDVCSSIRFSVDGATKETYERIRFGGKWEDLLENLELTKTKLMPHGFATSLNMVVSDDNWREIGQFIVRFREYVRYPQTSIQFTLINSLSPNTQYFETVNPVKSRTHQKKMCEFGNLGTPFCFFDGRVSACCRDYDGSLVMGDITEQSIDEIRKGPLAKKFRRAHETGDLADYTLCRNCEEPDPRVSTLFRELMRHTISLRPEADAEYYQQRADKLLEAFQGSSPLVPQIERLN